MQITPQTEQKLRQIAQREGTKMSALVDSLLTEVLGWDEEPLTDTVAAIRAGLIAAENGREKPLSVYIPEQRERQSFPNT